MAEKIDCVWSEWSEWLITDDKGQVFPEVSIYANPSPHNKCIKVVEVDDTVFNENVCNGTKVASYMIKNRTRSRTLLQDAKGMDCKGSSNQGDTDVDKRYDSQFHCK